MSRVRVRLAVAGIAAVVVAALLFAFEPWRAFTSSSVDEALPASTPKSSTGASPTQTTRQTPAPATPADLARGRFVDAEHQTSGTARIVQLADGRRVLRLEDLATSDGPDLHMWISEQPSGGAWGSYDDGRFLRLGELKATHGNHNYEIPASADLSGMRSVVIWCDRFNVAFGTAAISVKAAT